MHPAPSVILFSVLSGLGFGLLAWLGFGSALAAGWVGFLWWGLGYGLALGGILASTFHLGNPQRVLLAFTQWRSSWLSREAWAAVLALLVLAPMALSDWLGLGWPRLWGWAGGSLALLTVFTTAMIYTQIKAVPRWHHWSTPLVFLSFALTGGAMLSGQVVVARWLLAALGLGLVVVWRIGDGQFMRRAVSIGSATGLGFIGKVEVFEQAHTAGNYLLREMIFVVARKHAQKLRGLVLICACLMPMLMLLVLPVYVATIGSAATVHLIGALAARWLFFAEAEHVVGLYYGKR